MPKSRFLLINQQQVLMAPSSTTGDGGDRQAPAHWHRPAPKKQSPPRMERSADW